MTNERALEAAWSRAVGIVGKVPESCTIVTLMKDDLGEAITAYLSAIDAAEKPSPPAEVGGVEPVGFARHIDVDPKERPFEGRTSFWCSERRSAYYTEPVYSASALSAQAEEIERLRKERDEPVYHFSARVGKTHEWVGKERLTAAEAKLAAAKRRIEELEAGRDALAAHVHFLRDALWVTNKSIWRDVKLSASAQDALDALESWEDHLVSEWIEVLDGYDVETKALPKGHETPSLGCSSYNWRTQIVGELRKRFEAMRRTPHGVAGGEEVADGYKAGE